MTSKNQDPVKAYLSEIGRIPLLTRQQEIDLAHAVQAGIKAQEYLKNAEGKDCPSYDGVYGYGGPCWTCRGEREHCVLGEAEDMIKLGKEAEKKMINSNLRLVVSIAKNHVGRGLLLLDLIQEGNVGLMTAVQKFDPDKGNKFSTYATWWIKQAVTRAIANQGRTIRLPVHMVETVNKLRWVERDLMSELQREPTIAELTIKLIQVDPKRKWNEEKVEEIIKVSQEALSLDFPVGEDEEGSSLVDFISYEDDEFEELFEEDEWTGFSTTSIHRGDFRERRIVE